MNVLALDADDDTAFAYVMKFLAAATAPTLAGSAGAIATFRV